MKDLKECLPYYLNTGLKCNVMGEFTEESEYSDVHIPKVFEIIGMNADFVEVYESGRTITDECVLSDCFPHFLPLSALTEPLEDGIIPIVELANMAKFTLFISDKIKVTDRAVNISDNKYLFGFNFKWNSFHSYSIEDQNPISVKNQFQLFQYLFKHHFDVFGLIESGQAIDKRTIK